MHLKCPHFLIQRYEGIDWEMVSGGPLCRFDASCAATGVEAAQRAPKTAGVAPSSEL